MSIRQSKREIRTDVGELCFDQFCSGEAHPVQEIAGIVISMVTQLLAEQGVAVAAGGMNMKMLRVPADGEGAYRIDFSFFVTPSIDEERLTNLAKYAAELMADMVEDESVPEEDREELRQALRRGGDDA